MLNEKVTGFGWHESMALNVCFIENTETLRLIKIGNKSVFIKSIQDLMKAEERAPVISKNRVMVFLQRSFGNSPQDGVTVIVSVS